MEKCCLLACSLALSARSFLNSQGALCRDGVTHNAIVIIPHQLSVQTIPVGQPDLYCFSIESLSDGSLGYVKLTNGTK